MAVLPISEAVIRQSATAESFHRGQEYEREGAVFSVSRRDSVVRAEVMGSLPHPYEVTISFDAAGIATALCTCPVEWGWCKHIVATLLVCLHQPDVVAERPPLEAVLADLDRDQLHGILVALAAQEPRLAETIEHQIARLPSSVGGATPPTAPNDRPPPAPVDAKALRRQVRGALHGLDRMRSSEAYWQVGGVVAEVRGILDQAWAFIRAGDGRTALTMLEAITDEYVEEWTTLDDSDGEAGEFFVNIGAAWTEALLTAELSSDERAAWAERLASWEDEVADYGIDDAFSAALDAAEIGWDDPDLESVLRGESDVDDDWHGWGEEINGGLTVARLNVLERQGRDEEFLRLARAAGLTSHVAVAQVRLGRFREAAAYGLAHFRSPGQALVLAQLLRERQELDLAVAVAEAGLTLDGSKAPLAIWLRDLAAALGKRDLALQAADIAFTDERSLASYLSVQELAGNDWPERRQRLLDHLRRATSFHRLGSVEVFLHEGLVDDAIAAVGDSTYYAEIEPVVMAAITIRPDWAIRAAKDQAEPIMNQGDAQRYHHAARWVGHVRDAYLAAGHRGEWQTYLDGLLDRHSRKYKLVPMLKALGRP